MPDEDFNEAVRIAQAECDKHRPQVVVGSSTVGGAYPSMVELPDGLVYCVYYEEGKGASIRAVRMRVDSKGVKIGGRKIEGEAGETPEGMPYPTAGSQG